MWLKTKVTFKDGDIYDGSCIGMINTNKIIAIQNYTSKQVSLDGYRRYDIDNRLYAITESGTYELADYSLEDYDRLMEILTLNK